VNKFIGKTNILSPEVWMFSLSQLPISNVKKIDLLASIYVTSAGRS
jgi:hypothetical protein